MDKYEFILITGKDISKPLRFWIKKIKAKNRHVELTLPIVKLKAL